MTTKLPALRLATTTMPSQATSLRARAMPPTAPLVPSFDPRSRRDACACEDATPASWLDGVPMGQVCDAEAVLALVERHGGYSTFSGHGFIAGPGARGCVPDGTLLVVADLGGSLLNHHGQHNESGYIRDGVSYHVYAPGDEYPRLHGGKAESLSLGTPSLNVRMKPMLGELRQVELEAQAGVVFWDACSFVRPLRG